MVKSLIAIFGILFFLSSILFAVSLWQDRSKAIVLDGTKTGFAVIGDDSPPPCLWKVNVADRVMTEDKSQAVLVQTTNPQKKECESILSLRAPGFDMSPPKEEQKINLKPQGKGSLSWILTPHKSGTFQIAASDLINTQILGITVTDMFGLTGNQTKIFSILGSIFGPMFTVPWWWDRLRKRKEKQK